MNAVDYLKRNKTNDNDIILLSKKTKKKPTNPTYNNFINGNKQENITVDDVIYKQPKTKKKQKNTILVERQTIANKNKPVNKNNKPLLIDYILQEIERINDIDY